MSPEERALNATRSQAPWDAFLAALVPQIAEQIRWAVEAEREACAQVLENGRFLHDQAPTKLFATEAAAAIRRRNDTV